MFLFLSFFKDFFFYFLCTISGVTRWISLRIKLETFLTCIDILTMIDKLSTFFHLRKKRFSFKSFSKTFKQIFFSLVFVFFYFCFFCLLMLMLNSMKCFSIENFSCSDTNNMTTGDRRDGLRKMEWGCENFLLERKLSFCICFIKVLAIFFCRPWTKNKSASQDDESFKKNTSQMPLNVVSIFDKLWNSKTIKKTMQIVTQTNY